MSGIYKDQDDDNGDEQRKKYTAQFRSRAFRTSTIAGSDTAERRDHYQQQPHAAGNISSHGCNAFRVGIDGLVKRLDERSGYVGRCFLRRLGGVFPKLSLDISDQSHPLGEFRWVIDQGPIFQPSVRIVSQQVLTGS